LTLALCLMFFTTLLADLPKAVLAAVVLMAVSGPLDFPAIAHMWRVSRMDFLSALAALIGVLLLGILQGIVLASLISVLLLLAQYSNHHLAILGRIPGGLHRPGKPWRSPYGLSMMRGAVVALKGCATRTGKPASALDRDATTARGLVMP
jgi:MFS superfamily sulfate permease-like transporter